jgi:peptidoglycan/LPS O-acetylase OafA/YrhL
MAGRLPHWGSLDGLRGVAVVAVMIYHFKARAFNAGYLGVDVFFVLSGFLITTLLLGETAAYGAVHLKHFYARRALRLFPALCGVILVSLAAALLWSSAPWSRATITGIPFVILYVGNWVRAFDPNPSSLGLLGHTWSLAVEEQFYLLWPVAFIVLLKISGRVRIGVVLLAMAAGVMAYRAALIAHGVSIDRISNGFDTHCDGLLLGCALAFLLTSAPTIAWLHPYRTPIRVAGSLGAAALLLFMALGTSRDPTIYGIGMSFAAIATFVIVLAVMTAGFPGCYLLETRLAVWIGRRSYGLYLWHYPVFLMWSFQGSAKAKAVEFAAAFAVSVVLAALSYRFIELPFLRQKRRFQREEAVPATLTHAEPGRLV